MHACDATYNNAGVQRPAVEMADASGEEFDRVTAINLRGIWNCMKYELRQMRETRSPARIAARHGSRSSFGQSGLAQRVRQRGYIFRVYVTGREDRGGDGVAGLQLE